MDDRTPRRTLSAPEPGGPATVATSLSRVLSVALTCLALFLFGLLLYQGWGRRGDLLVDFGRELYLPWRVSQGKVLYRDLAHLFGPVAVTVNAALFSILGPSLDTLYAVNAVFLLAFSTFLFLVLATIMGRPLALLCVLFFLLTFAFSHVDRLGNFNYVTPYSHELLHGLYVACLSLFLLGRFARTGRPALVFLLGLLAGAAFGLKSEVFLALLAAEAVFFPLLLLADKAPFKRVALCGGLYLAGFMVVPGLLAAYFLQWMSFQDFSANFLLMYLAPLRQTPEMQAYYGQMSGLAQLRDNARDYLLSIGINAFVLATPVLGCKLYAPAGRNRKFGLFVFYNALVGLCLLHAWKHYDKALFYDTSRIWSLLLLGALFPLLWGYLRGHGPARKRLALAIACTLFCLLLLGKNLFAVVFTFYGVFLTVPAFFLYYVFTVHVLPQRFSPEPAARALARVPVLAVFAVIALYGFRQTQASYAARTEPLHGPNGVLQVRPPAEAYQDLLDAIQASVGKGETLAVFPEGVMLNFLADRPSPLRSYAILPFEWSLFGGQAIMADLAAHPPTWVLLLMRTAKEYGHTFLCDSYGREVCALLGRDYVVAQTFGQAPLRYGDFGAVLYRHKEEPAGKGPAGP